MSIPSRRLLPFALSFAAAIASVGALGSCARQPPQQSDAHAAEARGAPRYEDELARLDSTLAAMGRRAEKMPRSSAAQELVAGLYLERARLTGAYEDYAKAEQHIERAFAVAGEGAGPFLTRASLHFSLHRLEQVERDLRAVEARGRLDDPTRAAVVGLRADVALQRGDYQAALTGFRRALDLHESPEGLFRLALYRWKTGDLAAAERHLDAAARLYHGPSAQTRAFFHLQRGLLALDQGHLEEALGHYRDADAQLSGFWLIEEHIAEVTALQGRTEEALQRYQDLCGRTRNPEFMDELATLYRTRGTRGDEARASAWIAEADRIYAARLERFPEATYGHALDHFLRFERDPAKVVALAERNRDLRPGGEAQVRLARAYLKAGRHADARAVIERVRQTPWTSPELTAAAAEVGLGARAAGRSSGE